MYNKFHRLLFLITSAFFLANCTTSFDERLKNLDAGLKKTFKMSDSKRLSKNNDKNLRVKSNSLKAETAEIEKISEERIEKQEKEKETKTPKIITTKIEKKSIIFLKPLLGDILQPYEKGVNDGIDISAVSGTPIKAAAKGVVVAITLDTEQRSILIMRHQGNLLTIYANISGITVEKGEQVEAGQVIAKVPDSKPSFLHFEVREGLESVDPTKYF
tara:strand:+ start:206 stop:853 length:648 start_codon:yes stop_codon:yes gene_type:complete